jgi:hypothetical protein
VNTDLKGHSIIVQRTQSSLELQLDNTFFNQTTIPTVPELDESILLTISPDHIYLGAEVDVTTGEVRDGFEGCLTGVTLDGRELPFSTEGNSDFSVIQFSSDSIVSGCPLGLVETTPSSFHVYIGIGSILAGVLIVSLLFIVVCAVGGFCYRSRHGEHQLHSQGGSPSHGGFTWQSAYNNQESRRQKSPPASSETFTLSPLKPGARVASKPDSRATETSLANREGTHVPAHQRPGSAHQPPSHSRQGSGIISPPAEGFSLISQPNPGFLQESPNTSEQDEERPPQRRHVRSPSEQPSVHSAGTTRSDATYIPTELLGKDDSEIRKHLLKRVEVADAENEEYDVDKMEAYTEEGPFEPLGSIGSLYDFVDETENMATQLSAHTTSSSGLTQAPPETAEKARVTASSRKLSEENTKLTKPHKRTRSPGGGKRPRVVMVNSNHITSSETLQAGEHSPTKSNALPSSTFSTQPGPITNPTQPPITSPAPPPTFTRHSTQPFSSTAIPTQPPTFTRSPTQPLPSTAASPTKDSNPPAPRHPVVKSSHVKDSMSSAAQHHTTSQALQVDTQSPPPLTDIEPHPLPTTKSPLKLNGTQNGLWEPVSKHSGSLSQPEPIRNSNLGMSSRDPTRLRRSGRKSHRVTDQSKAPIGNILDKFHQVTTNAGGRSGMKEETIIL